MTKQKNVLIVQDIACLGKCSMTIVLPILASSGVVCTPLPTALLSTHGGFKGLHYRDLTDDMEAIIEHFESLDYKYDALYTGFLSSLKQIEICTKLACKHENSLLFVDPVMADNGKFYSVYNTQMLEKMKELCFKADVLLPNLTEAAFLLGEEYINENYNREYVENLAKKLVYLGIKKVVITGVSFEKDKIGALCFDGEKFEYISTNKIDGSFHGTGDIFSSTVLAGLMNNFDLIKSTKIAVNFTADCIKRSVDMGIDKKYGVAFEPEIPNLIEKLNK
ncbi:MAG: pyridoxamine kinase [Clostridia bacterium]